MTPQWCVLNRAQVFSVLYDSERTRLKVQQREGQTTGFQND